MPNEKQLTDWQIAHKYVANRLWGWIPDREELRDLAGNPDLPEWRVEELAARIDKLVVSFRNKLIDRLRKAGVDPT